MHVQFSLQLINPSTQCYALQLTVLYGVILPFMASYSVMHILKETYACKIRHGHSYILYLLISLLLYEAEAADSRLKQSVNNKEANWRFSQALDICIYSHKHTLLYTVCILHGHYLIPTIPVFLKFSCYAQQDRICDVLV